MTLLHSLDVPVVGAPMAGGPTTPMLAAAVSDVGGLGMLAAGYQTPERLAADLVHTRDLTDRPFGVNLFVPAAPSRQEQDRRALSGAVDAYRERLAPEAQVRGVQLGTPAWEDTDRWEDKVLLVETLAPAVVSCTFGVPGGEVVARWKAAGIEVHVTATSLTEARAAADAGADALVLQGHEAGGHRGTHDPAVEPELIDHLGLVEMVAAELPGMPLVAAGGIVTSGDTRRALAAGASAVQVGTALLLATESGAHRTYRTALRHPDLHERVTTRCFSGRVAGAVLNDFVRRHDGEAPAAFPVVDQVTKPLRRAAAEAGDVHGIHVWAGAGWRAAQDAPAAEIMTSLAP